MFGNALKQFMKNSDNLFLNCLDILFLIFLSLITIFLYILQFDDSGSVEASWLHQLSSLNPDLLFLIKYQKVLEMFL